MPEERRGSAQSILAVSTIVSIIVGAVSILAYIQSAERRTTVMEVKIEHQTKTIEKMEEMLKQIEQRLKR